MTGREPHTYCEHCGNPLQPEDQFCGSCGAVVLPPAPQAEQVIEPSPAVHAPTRNNRTLLLVSIVGVLLLLVSGSAMALMGVGGEEVELASGVSAKVPEGWAVDSLSEDGGGVSLVPKGYETPKVEDFGYSDTKAGSEEAVIRAIETSECDPGPPSTGKGGRNEYITSGYDMSTNTSGSLENGEGTVSGHPATWGVSYQAGAGPWIIAGSTRAADYPTYVHQLLLVVCVKDLDLSVTMPLTAGLVESSNKAPKDKPTSARNATVPEAREEVHEEIRQRYEANVGAVTGLLESIDTSGWEGRTDVREIPTSLDGIDEELSDPFKGQLKDTRKSDTTKPNKPSNQPNSGKSGTTTPTTPSSQPDSDEERLKKFGREYDTANRGEDWKKTYSMLDESSQKEFTEEEWAEKQQAQRDATGTPAPLKSVTVELEEGVSDAPGTVTLNYEDGAEEDLTVLTFVAVTKQTSDKGPKRILTEEEIVELQQLATEGGNSERSEAKAEEAAEDYYRAAGSQDFDYTYDNLDSTTKSKFTREEWRRKNQWFADNAPAIYNIESVELDSTSQKPLAEVEVRLTGEDGSSSIRNTQFVFEDGEWLHRFAQEEIDLFEPGVSFEEWVDE